MKTRKRNRLEGYDYSQTGCYFITICTKNKECVLCKNVHSPASIFEAPEKFDLSPIGQVVEQGIHMISVIYPQFIVERYVIMPNHIHLLLLIQPSNGAEKNVTVSIVVKKLKEYATKTLHQSIWQKSFHDHIIRNEQDYLRISEYIQTNPLKWAVDCYYRG